LLYHQQSHRIPAPVVRAIAPRSKTAQVKRARFAFTQSLPSNRKADALSNRRLGRLRWETPGFASPPRDGFALDGPSSGVTVAAHLGRYG
jgi:hypothetical protein